jgi:outer membrane immunogenic protein
MIKNWLKGVAIAALMTAGAVAAQAADLPTRKEAPAPVFVPPPFTWTGFYIGLNAGGIISSGSRNATLVYPAADAFLNSYFPGGIGNGQSGFIGGGQAGYNWQTGAFVLGVVTDFDGTTLGKNFNYTSAPFAGVGPFFNGDTLNVNAKASLDWLGTTRGKVGFVVTPDNRLQIYGTGGVAYGGGSSHFSVYDSYYNAYWSGNPNSTRVGWTVGAGVEYAITNNITIGAEYLYVDLGDTHITANPNSIAASALPNVYATAKIDYNASIFRALVNYKF